MQKKPISKDFDVCQIIVRFKPEDDVVYVSKLYQLGDDLLHDEYHEFTLKTMPLQVALQMACAVVSNVGLLDFVEDAK